jgi:hypothetical protein
MEFNDFGFTSVNEEELEVVRKASVSIDKAQKLYDAVLPLLENLKDSPERDYIYWPSRTAKIEEFTLHLKNILKG